jgi:hypothetical protein
MSRRNPVQTTKAGQLAIDVKQTPEKLAETKQKIEKPERIVRGLTPVSAVSGLLRVNPALRGTTRHQHDLDHAHADTNMSKRQPRRHRRFSFFGASLNRISSNEDNRR